LAEAPSEIPRIQPARLAALARESRAEFVVVTGGEPAIHDLEPLAEALSGVLPMHIETSGAFPLRLGMGAESAWVTLSPKRNALALRENLLRADEIKLVISSPADLPFWHGVLRQSFGPRFRLRARSIWLHPEWSRREDARLLAAINRWVLHCSAPYRVGWQLHKCYNVDPPPPIRGCRGQGAHRG
jgi:organic radical activating enzyme